MDNQGINAMPFLFLVPILFVIGCFVVDFIPIFKTKSELKDDMEYVVHMYNEGSTDRILEYTHNKDVKTEIFNLEDNKVEIVLTKEVEIITPIVKIFLNNPHIVELKKTINRKQ